MESIMKRKSFFFFITLIVKIFNSSNTLVIWYEIQDSTTRTSIMNSGIVSWDEELFDTWLTFGSKKYVPTPQEIYYFFWFFRSELKVFLNKLLFLIYL